MSSDQRVTMYEMSENIRHFEIGLGGNSLARLYLVGATCRLHFDGDVRPDVMREIIDVVRAKLLGGLPPGLCIVYRGHLVSSFEFGAK
jgi:hypothetical protein